MLSLLASHPQIKLMALILTVHLNSTIVSTNHQIAIFANRLTTAILVLWDIICPGTAHKNA